MKAGLANSGLLVIMAAGIIGSCAKQAAPQGGLKDITPPVVVKSSPPSGTTGFRSKSIVITFDEYITLDKLSEKFMVSPPMEKKPDIYLKGKNLNIDFLEKLRDSTTYTLYFQDAIKDLNEGNAINNFQYVFATGKVIDSLSITGNVLLAGNLESGKDVLVMLHSMLADSAPRKKLPNYITLADINGGFRINNIREGRYRLFALTDNNNNKRYDLSDESFAFYDTVLNINPLQNWLPEKEDTTILNTENKKQTGQKNENKTQAGMKSEDNNKPDLRNGNKTKPAIPEINGRYKLFLFTALKKEHYLTSSSRKIPYQLVYTLSLPPDTMKFEFKLANYPAGNYFIERSARNDTMMVWLTDSTLYSSSAIQTCMTYPFTDSTGKLTCRMDTIEMRYLTPRQTRGRQKATPFKFATNISMGNIAPGQTILFSSLTPFSQPDTSKIHLYSKGPKSKIPLKYQLISDSSHSRRYLLKATLKEGDKYFLLADSAAFSNIYGEVSDSVGINFFVREAISFGHLTLKIDSGKGNLIIQLLDDKEKLVAERKIINGGTVKFPMLEKGFYRAKVIYDLNGDGHWTTGNFDKQMQPEPVSYYPGTIEMRADFEIINEWNVGIINVKDKSLKSKKEEI